MIVRVTGSQADRVQRCNASAALPQIHDANDDEDRDRGTAMHTFLDRCARIGRAAALAEVDEQHRAFCETINLAKLSLTLSTELALAYNWRDDTARILKPVAPRAYEIDEAAETALTIDVAGVDTDAGVVMVGDYKSGYGWLPDPRHSMQLGLAALSLARVYEAHSAQVEYIRIRSDGEPLRFDATLDTFGLEAVASRWRDAMERVTEMRAELERTGIAPNVTEGPWCRRCPARQHCPATTALVRKVLHDQPMPYVLPITPDNAAHVYELLKKARGALKVVEAAVQSYQRASGPIPLGRDEDGSVRYFGEYTRDTKEVLDGAVAYAVVAERIGPEAASKVVTMAVTKQAIGDVARAHRAEGQSIAAATDELLDEIRARGGSSYASTSKPTEYVVAEDGTTKQVRNTRKKAS